MPENVLTEKQLLVARNESQVYLNSLLTGNKVKLATSMDFFAKNFNVSYEELSCVGYNPETEELTAIIKIKRSFGYNGNLCSNGSFEYVRFYVNYGGGYQDVGYVGVNVHDIADSFDCSKNLEKPIEYAVRLKINPKHQICGQPLLPKVKAVLTWNVIPPANDPNLTQPGYVWGNVREEQIQIKPIKIKFPLGNIGSLLEKAVLNPNLSLKNIALNNPILNKNIDEAKNIIIGDKVDFPQLVNDYKLAKANVEPQRSGAKLLNEAITTTDIAVKKNIAELFLKNGFKFEQSIADLLKSKGNSSYEELGCVALDYNQEAFVATFKIKKNFGYGGNLCSKGSKEYVSFWIQDTSTNCEWKLVGTQAVSVFDISGHSGLSYSAILPFDLTTLKTFCADPKVIKVRAVLSWNIPSSQLDTPYWGNYKESYVQIPPLPKNWDGKSPKMVLLGGINVEKIDAITGLTLVDAKFQLNQNPVTIGSRFYGKVAVSGLIKPFVGTRYKIKVENLDNGSWYYVNESFDTIGLDSSNNIIITHMSVDAAGFYTYISPDLNMYNQIALFSPGTNNRLRITIENENGLKDSHVIQMDNTSPESYLKINDEGQCVHFKKGDVILGKFKAIDNFLFRYTLSVYGGRFTDMKFSGVPQLIDNDTNFVRTVNVTDGDFQITTAPDKNCGNIGLVIEQKTVVDSAYMASPVYATQAFCLKD